MSCENLKGLPLTRKFSNKVGLPHVWGEVHLAGITSHHVALEDLLLVQSEAVLGSKDQNLVVHGLACQPFTWGEKQANSMSAYGYTTLMS